ncbi:MAG: GtrA family protein [Clostridia bacterium]|nr:GtrA family protein [Clostridia bacterium]
MLSYEVLIYLFFGFVTTVLNIAALFVFKKMLGAGDDGESVVYFSLGALKFTSLLLANALAWVVAVIFAYVANKIWVFESKRWKASVVVRESLSFTAARLFSLAVEEIGLFVLCEVLGVNTLLTKILLGVIVVILNYLFSKILIFKGEGEKGVGSKGRQVLVMSAVILVLLVAAYFFAKNYQNKHPAGEEGSSYSVSDISEA